jgi:hypothetical protein
MLSSQANLSHKNAQTIGARTDFSGGNNRADGFSAVSRRWQRDLERAKLPLLKGV